MYLAGRTLTGPAAPSERQPALICTPAGAAGEPKCPYGRFVGDKVQYTQEEMMAGKKMTKAGLASKETAREVDAIRVKSVVKARATAENAKNRASNKAKK